MSRRTMTASLTLLAIVAVAPSAHASPPAKAEWLGSIPAAPVKRIVSLAPGWTEVLFALEAGGCVVGVTRYDDYPQEVLALPKVGGFVDADAEAVLATSPQMVVAAPVAGARARYESLARLGVPVLLLPAERISDLWDGIEYLSHLVGRPAVGRTLASQLKQGMTDVEAETRNKPQVRALILVGYKPLIVAGPQSFYDVLLGRLGAQNVITRGQPFTHLDLEAIAAAKPDVILDLTMGETAPTHVFAPLKGLAQKPPRIVRVQDAATLRLGPRLPQGMRALAKALYP